MIGKYSIKKQVDGRGFYGVIEISVKISKRQEIVFEEHLDNLESYETAIRGLFPQV